MLKVKPYRQKSGSCGPASLKMVLAYFGVKKSEQQLAKLSGWTEARGVEAKPLLRVAKSFGFKGLIKDFAEIEDIRNYVLKKKIPVIVDWFSVDDGHYSVVVGLNQRNIYLQDPELGKIRVMKIETFKRVWFDFPKSYIRSKKRFDITKDIGYI